MSGGGGVTAQAPDYTWANSQWGQQLSTAQTNMKAAQDWATAHGTTLDEALKQIQPQTLQAGADTMATGQDLYKIRGHVWAAR